MEEKHLEYLRHQYASEPRRQRLDRLLSMDDALEIMCAFVSSGGSLINFAKIWDVRFCDIMRWIRTDSVRNERYELALKDRKEYSFEAVMGELHDIGLVDMRQIFEPDGSLKPVDQWPKSAAAAVASLDVQEERDQEGQVIGHTKKVKFHDKAKAIALIAKTHKEFIERVEETKTLKLEDLVLASYQKLEEKK
jgi:hypothetical protein